MARLIPDMLTEGDYPVEFGRYHLLGLLGEGAMARVYRAELRGPDGFTKPAALKIVRSAVAGRSAALRSALLNEARLGGLLDHPNLVQTLDYGVVDDLPYIAMGLVRGIGLDRLMTSELEVPPEVGIEIVRQICRGLHHAHAIPGQGAGLIHRDLKPSNVIVDRHGLVRVLDFGIAKAAAATVDTTEAGVTKGTPAYMSPEQAAGQELDRRSDIFSVGTLLYEIVTGDRLFASTSPLATLGRITRVEERIAEPAFADRLDAIVPGLGPVVTRCLRADRSDRYPTCAELERDLRDLAAGYTQPPVLREWVADTRVALGMEIDDPAGLSTETLRPVSSWGPSGRPRVVEASEEVPDDVVTESPIASVSGVLPTVVPSTRRMVAVPPASSLPAAPRVGRGLLIALAAGASLVVAALILATRPAPEAPPATSAAPAGPTAPHPRLDPALSEPLEVAEPTPEAAPAPSSTAPRATKRPRARASATATATGSGEERAPPPEVSADMQFASREGATAKVVVTARVDAPASSRLWVHYKRPLGPWKKAPLDSIGPGGWFKMVELVGLPPGAALRWYLTAELDIADGGARVRVGSRTSPRKFVLPRP